MIQHLCLSHTKKQGAHYLQKEILQQMNLAGIITITTPQQVVLLTKYLYIDAHKQATSNSLFGEDDNTVTNANTKSTPLFGNNDYSNSLFGDDDDNNDNNDNEDNDESSNQFVAVSLSDDKEEEKIPEIKNTNAKILKVEAVKPPEQPLLSRQPTKQNKTEDNSSFFEIQVTNPEIVGEGVSSYVTYTIDTKVMIILN